VERQLPALVLGVSLVVLVLGASGGAGWGGGPEAAVVATQLDHSTAPLYGILAGTVAHLPVGEPGLRLALLGALLGALTLAGVVVAARALLPKDPLAGVVGAVLLLLAPPFRDAAGFATPSILAACGTVWAIAFALEHARTASGRRAALAIAAVAVVLGSAPWLGAALAIAITGWLARTASSRAVIGFALGAVGALVIAGCLASPRAAGLPAPAPSLTAMVAASGVGAAAIVIGAGLLGAAFATVTELAHARWLGVAILLAAVHAVVFDHQPAPLLGLLAIGCAVIPSAIVRVVGSPRRNLVALVAGIPLVGGAVLAGPATVTTRDPRWTAVHDAQDVIVRATDALLAELRKKKPPVTLGKATGGTRTGVRGSMATPGAGGTPVSRRANYSVLAVLSSMPPCFARSIPSASHPRFDDLVRE
jgi:hypothetical protein